MFLSHSTGTPILATDDAAMLVWLGLATQPDEYGNRQLHKQIIQSQSSYGFHHYSNGPGFEGNPDAFVTIPDRIVSEATIYYLGFTAEKTAEIWRGWEDMYLDFTELPEALFRGHVLSYIDGTIDVNSKKDDKTWRRVLNLWGVATALQDVILHPAYRGERAGISCAACAKKMIRTRFSTLRDIQIASRSRAKCLEPTD